MATNIGAKLELAGEKQFRQALSDINAGLKVTASELALVTAKYADNDKSVAALTARNEALQNSITVQTAKVQTLKNALENAATVYGETDAKTLKYAESLNKAEAELVGMEKDLQSNSKQLGKSKQDMEKYGLSVDEVAKSQGTFGEKLSSIIEGLGIHLPAGADKAIKAMDGTKVSTLALVGVTVGLIAGFSKLTVETAKASDEILTMSKVTGLSTDTIQEMNYASELVDVSADTMTGAMRKMINSMGDAQNGNKEASESFRKLHLSINDNGHLKDSEQMFYEVIDALGKMTNETERDALSMKVFGKSAQELNPLIEAGSKSLKEFGKQAQEMGYVMSGETLEAFGKLDDEMRMFDNQTTSVKNSLALVLLPVLTGFFEVLSKINPKVIATIGIIASIAIVAITVVKGVKDITETFKGLDTKALRTTAIIVGVVAGLIALAAIIAVVSGKSDELNKTMASVGSSVSNMANTVNGAGNNIGYNATGTNNWRGGWTWVGEQGPELINPPAGTRILSNRQSMNMVQESANGGGDMYIFQPGSVVIDAKNVKDFTDVVEAAKGQKQRDRAGEVAMA